MILVTFQVWLGVPNLELEFEVEASTNEIVLINLLERPIGRKRKDGTYIDYKGKRTRLWSR